MIRLLGVFATLVMVLTFFGSGCKSKVEKVCLDQPECVEAIKKFVAEGDCDEDKYLECIQLNRFLESRVYPHCNCVACEKKDSWCDGEKSPWSSPGAK